MKLVVVRTNDSLNYINTVDSALRYFDAEDIQVCESFEGIINKAVMFAVPYLCNYKGTAIGITDNLVFTKGMKRMLFNLPPLDPYTYDFDGDIVAWNCEHGTSVASFSHSNLADVKLHAGAYVSNIDGKNNKGYTDLSFGVKKNV